MNYITKIYTNASTMQNIVHEDTYFIFEWKCFYINGKPEKLAFCFKMHWLYSQRSSKNTLNIKFTGMNWSFSNSAIGRLRMAGIAEGISFVTLLFIAMPLKYLAGDPRLVLYVGWVHGLLFMLYLLALVTVKINLEWKFKKTSLSFLASLIPFGTFIMDKSWRKEERQWMKEK